MHEQTMIGKYTDLSLVEDATCPTCDQEINQAFVQQEIKEHKMRYDQCLKFAAKDREKLEEVEKNNEIHRKAKREVRNWEDLYRSIDNELPQRVLEKESIENEIKTLRERITTSREDLRRVVDENEKRERHNTRIGIILEQTDEFQAQLDDFDMDLRVSRTNLRFLRYLRKRLVQTDSLPTK